MGRRIFSWKAEQVFTRYCTYRSSPDHKRSIGALQRICSTVNVFYYSSRRQALVSFFIICLLHLVSKITTDTLPLAEQGFVKATTKEKH